MTNNQLIEEIVTKECERYALEDSGFITDKRAVVKELSSADNASLPDACSLKEGICQVLLPESGETCYVPDGEAVIAECVV